MEDTDYIIVGLGIAGISLCETFRKHGKSFIIVDSGIAGATAKSGGVFNPTVLKRFTAAWNASLFYPFAVDFYRGLSEELNQEVLKEIPLLRIFKSVEEQNNWSVASDKKELQKFLGSEFLKNTNPAVRAPFGFGKVLGTGLINTDQLLMGYRNLLQKKKLLLSEDFEYEMLQQHQKSVVYKNISAKAIIFAQGAMAVNNPFFPRNLLIGNKGEYLIIEAPGLKMDTLLKGPLYVIPLGNDQYKVGATYNHDDHSSHPTEVVRSEIISKFKTFINCPFKLIGHSAGIRPTTKDHRPLLGSFPKNPNLFFFNGLGSRGFLMAPLLAEISYKNLENNIPLPREMDILRRVL